jgi:hypothetical protein
MATRNVQANYARASMISGEHPVVNVPWRGLRFNVCPDAGRVDDVAPLVAFDQHFLVSLQRLEYAIE